ncbi:MAG TPA: hypothetical protein VJ438_00150 [Candidatus Nanoarchaeia archaeon]|nr:hypothetical protein [Candidatus Nanoarchaeia archaeon]
MKEVKGQFELFDIDVKRTVQGNRLRVFLRVEEDKSLEKKIIDFRDENVLVTINQIVPPESIADIISVEKKFILFDSKSKTSRNGRSTYVILDKDYDKEDHKELLDLQFQDVNVTVVLTDPDLPFKEEEPEPESQLFEVKRKEKK